MQIKLSSKALGELMKNSTEFEKIRKLCKHKLFLPGKVIAREGEISDFFFILEGNVNCYKNACGAEPIALTRGTTFGDESRLTNTYISTTHVKCLCLTRKQYGQIIEKANAMEFNCNTQSMSNATIEDFEMIRILGQGSFSTVSLAKLAPARGNKFENKGLFALKCYTGKNSENYYKTVEELIENEMTITSQLDNSFIVRSFGGFSNNDNIYHIFEALLGGDLYQLLQIQSKFDEDWVRFYAASVLHAFAAMHSKNIVYRDLKPENLILTSQGYIKIIDFGLSKKLIDEKKTYTCCGTVSVK